ncbi:MAG TPA: TIR domain-containing protein, partial [Candidatus Binatia bacterium]|nr:TIR domain-containing protein [Candidatus Binatia bacterium]
MSRTISAYRVTAQDYDSVPGRNFADFIHDALIQAQHLVLLHTADYDEAEWTRAELFNFLASPDREAQARRICVLRCDASRPRGLLSGVVYGDLVGVTDAAERKRIILAVARGEGPRLRPGPRIFGGAMPLENRLFTGRGDLLERMHLALAAEDGTAALTLAAVHGLSGVGKTSLARAYAQRFGDRFAGVWWIAAADRLGIQTGLAALAHELEPALPAETKLDDAAHLALARLAAHRGTPFLLVYDNVPDPEALAELLPTRGARLLLTSRWPDWEALATSLPVDVLAEDEAVAFLLRRAGSQDADGARALARLLGCLPLALDHAGAYVKQAVGSSFASYAARVEALLATRPRGTEYPASVAATFTLAIEAAGGESAAAETVLGLFAWLAPEAIPLALVDAEAMAEAERDAGLMALAHLSLVTRQADGALGPSVGVHRLVQAVMRAGLAEQGRTEAARDAAVAALARHFPGGAYRDTRDWPVCAALLPHVESLVALIEADWASPNLGEALNRAGGFLHGRGLLHAAEPLFRRALEVSERMLGPEHPLTLTNVNNLT